MWSVYWIHIEQNKNVVASDVYCQASWGSSEHHVNRKHWSQSGSVAWNEWISYKLVYKHVPLKEVCMTVINLVYLPINWKYIDKFFGESHFSTVTLTHTNTTFTTTTFTTTNCLWVGAVGIHRLGIWQMPLTFLSCKFSQTKQLIEKKKKVFTCCPDIQFHDHDLHFMAWLCFFPLLLYACDNDVDTNFWMWNIFFLFVPKSLSINLSWKTCLDFLLTNLK